MNCLDRVKRALLTVSENVGHYEALKETPPYIVWAEERGNDLEADNVHAERGWTGTVDLFTKTENDPLVEAVGEALSSAGIAWYLNSVQFEDDTGLIHHEWVWEVA